jgi:Helix-turn-helix domain
MRPPIFSRNIIRHYRLNSLPAAVFGVMHSAPPLEPFVDAARAAEFLSLKPRRVLELARSGELPAYPLGNNLRRVWRFRLSELVMAMARRATGPMLYEPADTSYRTLPPQRHPRSKN